MAAALEGGYVNEMHSHGRLTCRSTLPFHSSFVKHSTKSVPLMWFEFVCVVLPIRSTNKLKSTQVSKAANSRTWTQ